MQVNPGLTKQLTTALAKAAGGGPVAEALPKEVNAQRAFDMHSLANDIFVEKHRVHGFTPAPSMYSQVNAQQALDIFVEELRTTSTTLQVSH